MENKYVNITINSLTIKLKLPSEFIIIRLSVKVGRINQLVAYWWRTTISS